MLTKYTFHASYFALTGAVPSDRLGIEAPSIALAYAVSNSELNTALAPLVARRPLDKGCGFAELRLGRALGEPTVRFAAG